MVRTRSTASLTSPGMNGTRWNASLPQGDMRLGSTAKNAVATHRTSELVCSIYSFRSSSSWQLLPPPALWLLPRRRHLRARELQPRLSSGHATGLPAHPVWEWLAASTRRPALRGNCDNKAQGHKRVKRGLLGLLAWLIYALFGPAAEATPKPPPSQLQAIYLGAASHPQATLMRLPCDPRATFMRPPSQRKTMAKCGRWRLSDFWRGTAAQRHLGTAATDFPQFQKFKGPNKCCGSSRNSGPT